MPEYEGIPYDLVIDGKVMHENLKAIGRDYNWLLKQTEKFKIKPEEALVVTYDGKGQIFCQEKDNFLPMPVKKNYQEKKLWKRKKRKASGKKKASQMLP